MLKAAILVVAPLFWTISPVADLTHLASNISTPASACKLKLAHKTTPKLPKHLRGVRSDLMVRLIVRADGRVTTAEILRGTGNRDVDAAVATAMKDEWRYKPLRDCASTEEVIMVELDYKDKVLK